MSEFSDERYDPVSVVINVHNEASTIENEIRSIHYTILSRIPGSEFIVAEDGSTDGTKEIIARLVEELGIIYVTSQNRKGYAKALKDAVCRSTRQYVFYSDTGNKYEPQDFWKLYTNRRDHDLVIGVRTDRTDQWYRRVLSWGYNKLLLVYFGVNLQDADSGFRLFSRRAVQKVLDEEWINNDLIASEITLRVKHSGFSIKEIPVSYRRRIGASRGLPFEQILGVVFRVTKNFRKLRTIFSDPMYSRN